MSYILDALKRADTERERERGNVPGLHSQNLPSGSLPRERQRKTSRPVPYAAGIGLALLALATWWLFRPATEEHPNAVPPVASGIEDRDDPPPAATEALVASGHAVRQAPELPILAPPPPTAPQPVRAERPRAASANVMAAPDTAPTAASTPPSQPAPVRRFAELSPEFRAQLPQVNISGSTYSSNPAQRTLIANGKMIQEGEEIAPGLQLETIGQRSAVLNFQGTRYSIGY